MTCLIAPTSSERFLFRARVHYQLRHWGSRLSLSEPHRTFSYFCQNRAILSYRLSPFPSQSPSGLVWMHLFSSQPPLVPNKSTGKSIKTKELKQKQRQKIDTASSRFSHNHEHHQSDPQDGAWPQNSKRRNLNRRTRKWANAQTVKTKTKPDSQPQLQAKDQGQALIQPQSQTKSQSQSTSADAATTTNTNMDSRDARIYRHLEQTLWHALRGVGVGGVAAGAGVAVIPGDKAGAESKNEYESRNGNVKKDLDSWASNLGSQSQLDDLTFADGGRGHKHAAADMESIELAAVFRDTFAKGGSRR